MHLSPSHFSSVSKHRGCANGYEFSIFFDDGFFFFIKFRIAALRSACFPDGLGRAQIAILEGLRLPMFVVGVAKGWLSLEVTRSKRSLLFLLWMSPEPSPSTSVVDRTLLVDGVREKVVGGWVKSKLDNGTSSAENIK